MRTLRFSWHGLGALLLAAALLAGSVARADYMPSELSLHVGDAQPFAKFDPSTFDRHPWANEGYFVSFDLVKYVVSAPRQATIGGSWNDPIGAVGTISGRPPLQDPLQAPGSTNRPPTRPNANVFIGNVNPIQEFNSMSTGELSWQGHDGNDTTFGYIENCCGWFVRIQDLNSHDEELYGSDVGLILNDPQNLMVGFFDMFGGGADDDFDGDLGNGRDQVVASVPGIGVGQSDIFTLIADGVPVAVQTTARNSIDMGDIVPQGILLDHVHVRNSTDYSTAEANRLWRFPREHCGSFWEMFGGLRYLQFDEDFLLETERGIIHNTDVNTEARNRMLAPQIGCRWFRRTCRWTVSFEGRAVAGVNFQSVNQRYTVGDHLTPLFLGNFSRQFVAAVSGTFNDVFLPPLFPLNFEAQDLTGGTDINARQALTRTRFDAFKRQGGNHTEHDTVFSPALEIGFTGSYNITRQFALRGGAKAMYISNVARPSNMVSYTFPDFGILLENNRDDVFMYGIHFGFEFNR